MLDVTCPPFISKDRHERSSLMRDEKPQCVLEVIDRPQQLVVVDNQQEPTKSACCHQSKIYKITARKQK